MDQLAQALKDNDIHFVRIVWCDNANVIRGKAFHTTFLAEHQQHGIGISQGQQGVPVMYDAVVPDSGLGPVGEVWLAPDWSTLQLLPYATGHARVMGTMQHRGEPWALCPRSFLSRMIARAAEAGYTVQAAFENEFYLLRTEAGVLGSGDKTLFAATQAMDLYHPVIDAIATALIQQGIPVERYYPESGPGQHEIAIRYTHALQAADWQIMFRETVRAIANRHGYTASFVPKIFQDHAGSGCHLHLSLWQNGKNLMPGLGGELSAIARHFIGGILHHLPALMALTTPSVNSYRRLQPNFWSGAYRCWGMDNREAAVRVPTNPTLPSPTHIELKTVDASANPYLALGATIAAGLDGVLQQREPGDALAINPALLSEDERTHQGIDRLPQTLNDAIAHLQQSPLFLDALGAPLSTAFIGVRTAEWQAMKEWTLEQEVALLLERY
ncbi:glutamine synthetase family protein [Leptolyngbya sp. AN02str]|uniref:glutamine synthetase family protein n=1 Tax=Leptolyngbya sp. AN02str TaxID=3423363 RepID=UPI003D314E9A